MSSEIGAIGLSSSLTNSIQNHQQQIASGQRVNQAKDDPAGIQVIMEMTGEIRGNSVAMRNSSDGISALQVAESGASQITDSLQQLQTLAVQAGNGILSSSDRAALQQQANQLLAGIKDSISNSQFNGRSLLADDGGLNLQTGANAGDTQSVRSFDLSKQLGDLDLFNLDFTSTDPSKAFESIDKSMELMGEVSAEFGANHNRLERSIDSLMNQNINEVAARSRIADTDMAKAISELSQEQVQQQAQIAMQAQANASRGQVLSLLN